MPLQKHVNCRGPQLYARSRTADRITSHNMRYNSLSCSRLLGLSTKNLSQQRYSANTNCVQLQTSRSMRWGPPTISRIIDDIVINNAFVVRQQKVVNMPVKQTIYLKSTRLPARTRFIVSRNGDVNHIFSPMRGHGHHMMSASCSTCRNTADQSNACTKR